MKVPHDIESKEVLRTLLEKRFAEFNRKSPSVNGRRYPRELQELVRRGKKCGITYSELQRLTGMSATAITSAIRKVKDTVSSPKRLEVIGTTTKQQSDTNVFTIRLPSGVCIELSKAELLTPTLLITLAKLEVHHVASR